MSNRDVAALIVLNYNDSDTTIRLVETVRKYSGIDRIVIVDNKSTDDSFEALQELRSDKVDVIQAPSNGGFASGNNYGIRYAMEKHDAAYVIIANPDVEFEEAAVASMLKVMKSDDTIGITAPWMLNKDGKPVRTAWKLPGYWSCVRDCFIVSNSIHDKFASHRNNTGHVARMTSLVLQGSLFMMSAAAYKAVGGLDEGTFLYYEESILAHRLYRQGFREQLIPNVQYIHRHSESIDKNIKSEKAKFNIQQESREYYCVQYLGTGHIRIRLLRIAFHIGLLNFLICRKVQRAFRVVTGAATRPAVGPASGTNENGAGTER